MLKRFEVKNYKNFKDKIAIDFSKVGDYQFNIDCIANRMIGKMLIYGKNATGKSNLGNALFDITTNLSDMRLIRVQQEMYLNANSVESYAEFKYVFQFQQDEVIYQYRKYSEIQLYDEDLLLNGECCFYYNFDTKESHFDKLNYLEAETVVIERYLEAMNENQNEEDEINRTLSFLQWLIINTVLTSNSILLKMDAFIKGMYMMTVENMVMNRPVRLYEDFFETLADKDMVEDFEKFLNIMGVECKLVLEELPDKQKALYFKHERLVPFFENASSGMRSLFYLYRRLGIAWTANMVYIDAFDAFYHYEMAENVIKFFKEKYPECQVILTTHNTNLMTNQLLRPDCVFILSRGNLTALCDSTPRALRESHNLEKMYISGEFDWYE